MISMPDIFYLDTDEGSFLCHVITTLYLKEYDHHYLVYDMDEKHKDSVFVSIYQPGEEIKELLDVEGEELEKVIQILESEEWL